MKFDLRDFQLVEAIHQQGTFAKAADQLHRTPSAITQSIQKLEHLLGFQIFDRSAYRPILTNEGRLFLERGKQILKQMDRLDYDLSSIKKGWETEFSIAYDDLLSIEGVLSLIKDFQKIAPSISIRLSREVLNGCWDALVQDRATLALGASGEPPVGMATSQKTLGAVNFVFAVAPQHPLAVSSNYLSREEISAYYSIVVADTSQYLPVRTSGRFLGQPVIVVPSMEAKILAQVQGLGVGYLPRHRIERLLKNGQLIECKVDQQKSKTYLKTAWCTDKTSKALAWFLEKLDKEEIQKKFFQ